MACDIKLYTPFLVGKRDFAILSIQSSGLLQRPRLSQGALGAQHYEILKHRGIINTICNESI